MSDIVERLRAEEARQQKLFDHVEKQREKFYGTEAAVAMSGIKHAISGRDPVLIEAADEIERLRDACEKRKRNWLQAEANMDEAAAELIAITRNDALEEAAKVVRSYIDPARRPDAAQLRVGIADAIRRLKEEADAT